jgi:hypothetical protein
MKSREYYLSLIDSARKLVTTLEAVGCCGFDFQRAGIISSDSAFAVAEGIDTAIMLLNDTIAACRHAIDLIDNKPYSIPLSDTERKLIEIAGQLIESLCCSTLPNAP